MKQIDSLGDLSPDPRNARRHNPRNVGMIEQALGEVGAARSIVIDEDGVVLAGNATIEAAAQAGIERVQVVEADGNTIVAVRRSGLTPEQKTKLALYDNRAAELADWDAGVLAALAEETDLSQLFRDDELAALLADAGAVDIGGAGDEFDATPADGPTRTHLGDLWEIGPHRLLVGDCTDAANVERLMGGERAGAVVTDPPYGMAYEPNHDARRVKHNYNGAGYHNVKHQTMIAGDDDEYDPRFLMELFKETKEQFWFGADYYRQHLPDGGSWLVWDKRYGIEDMDFNTSHFELCWSSARHLREIIRCKWFGIQGTEQQDMRERLHTTQKPLQVIAWIIERYTKMGDLIADMYLGSGTTLIAAHQTGRRCYGMEISPRYADVILRRAEAAGLSCVRYGSE